MLYLVFAAASLLFSAALAAPTVLQNDLKARQATSITLSNSASTNITVYFWNSGQQYLKSYPPKMTIALAQGAQQSVSTSITSGAFAALYGTQTLDSTGVVSNTWGEFVTGSQAAFDVNRQENMDGMGLTINGNNGCVSKYAGGANLCDFVCNNGVKQCDGAASGSTSLLNCAPGSQPGAESATYNGQPAGGCTGWTSFSVVFSDS